MEPGLVRELREAWRRREAMKDYRFGVLAAAIANAFRSTGSPAKPEEFFPGVRILRPVRDDDDFGRHLDRTADALGVKLDG